MRRNDSPALALSDARLRGPAAGFERLQPLHQRFTHQWVAEVDTGTVAARGAEQVLRQDDLRIALRLQRLEIRDRIADQIIETDILVGNAVHEGGIGAIFEKAAHEIGEQLLVASDRGVDAHRSRLLANALLTILFLSDTYGGRVHDLRIAEATPYPLPAGSGLLQDLGFLSFTLPQVEILMPMKKPRGEELTLEQQLANQALHQRRLRIEHVNSSVKRCRVVKDRIRLWKQGVRDLVMELCCALHNFRVRLSPWQPMI